MQNYAKEWKKKSNFRQISYNDFVTIPDDNGIYIAKVDGMLGLLVFENNKILFQTTTGHSIENIPAADDYKALFNKLKIKQAMIAGELVAQRSGAILSFNDTQSIVKTSYKPENGNLVFHYPVDVIEINKKKLSFIQALQFLDKHIGKIGLPHVQMPMYDIGKLDKFRKLYDKILGKQGYDGVVVRNYNGRNYKVKFVETVDLLVIGAGHEDMRAWQKKEISYLLSSFIDKNGIYRSSSKIGTGFTTAQRSKFYKFILDNQLYKSNGEYFIKPQLIVETKFFRSRITDTPAYRFKNNKYELVGRELSVTFSHPSFERIRPDKKATKFDVRLEQIPQFKY